jgi:hypothetical protein
LPQTKGYFHHPAQSFLDASGQANATGPVSLNARHFLCSSVRQENMKMPAKKRELIEPHAGDKRYVRRDDKGQFKESDNVSRSLSQDVRKKASTVSKAGQGDRGDRK